jgi:hypothetical protein
LLPDGPSLRGDRAVVEDERTGVPHRTEVLGGIEAGRSGRPDGAGRDAAASALCAWRASSRIAGHFALGERSECLHVPGTITSFPAEID